MKLLWGQKVTFHRMIPSVPILLLEPSRAVLCGTEFAIRRAVTCPNYYSIFPLRSPSSFDLAMGKGLQSFF